MIRFNQHILPGLVFQSVLVGGGYATGRELVEFFLISGPLAGLLGMLLAAGLWSLLLAISFEFVRITKSYDYRSLFRLLLGRAWILFEVAYLALTLLVISVLGAATGELVYETFGIPRLPGIVAMIGLIGVLAFYGSKTIERFLAGWSFVLYVAFVLYFMLWFGTFGDQIVLNFSADPVEGGFLLRSISYAGFNAVAVIAVLFSLRHLTTRRDALLAGVLAGPLAIIPGVLFYIAMVGFYPEVLSKPVPVNFMLAQLEMPALQVMFQIVLIGTFTETGLGIIHSVNERVAQTLQDHGRVMPSWARAVIAISLLGFSIFLASRLGIIALISKGYLTLAYVMLAVFALPMLTVGLWRVLRPPERPSEEPTSHASSPGETEET